MNYLFLAVALVFVLSGVSSFAVDDFIQLGPKPVDSEYSGIAFKSQIPPDLVQSLTSQSECFDCGDKLSQATLDSLANHHGLRCLTTRAPLSVLDLGVLNRVPDLAVLRLYGPNLNEQNIQQIASLKSLRCLELNDKQLTPQCLSALGNVHQLEDLRITCSLKNADISSFNQLPHLQRLELKGPGLSTIINQVSKLHNLRVLKLGNLDDIDLARLSELTHLVFLSVVGNMNCRFDGYTVYELKNIPLKYLVIQNCPISPAGFQSISQLDGLRGLDLIGTRPVDTSLMDFASLRNLRRLRIWCTKDGAPDLEKLSKKIPSCTIEVATNRPTY